MKICNEDINLIKYLSLICIYVTQLRLGKMNKDEKLIIMINNLIFKLVSYLNILKLLKESGFKSSCFPSFYSYPF